MALVVKNPPANTGGVRDTDWSLGREDPLEESVVTHSSLLAWKIPWTEEPGGLHPIGLPKSCTWLNGWTTARAGPTCRPHVQALYVSQRARWSWAGPVRVAESTTGSTRSPWTCVYTASLLPCQAPSHLTWPNIQPSPLPRGELAVSQQSLARSMAFIQGQTDSTAWLQIRDRGLSTAVGSEGSWALC